MKTLALVNQKGGCGKTTTAVNLAGALAARGQRVLLVDLDPQAHATLALSVAVEDDESSLAEVLMNGAPLREAIQPAPGGIALVPSRAHLGELEEVALRVVNPEKLLGYALKTVADAYDLAILDCPPRADGVLSANALRAADTVCLVVETGAFALQGALRAVRILEEVADGMEAEFQLRVVATMFHRREPLARELLIATQARFGSLVFDSVIHDDPRLREAAASGVPIQVLDPGGAAARDFDSLAEEVLGLGEPAPPGSLASGAAPPAGRSGRPPLERSTVPSR